MLEDAKPRVRIMGCRIVARAQDGNGQSGLIAIVDCVVPLFVMHGAELYRQRNGSLSISPPRGMKGDYSTGLKFTDDDLRSELLQAACRAAAGLGANVEIGSDEDAHGDE